MNIQQETSGKHPIFPNLNGLRFAGAIAVIIYHCYTLNREIWGSFYYGYAFQKAWIFISKGHFGVSMFFIMSGFLITYLLLHESSREGKINLFNYLMRRFLRVWPLYFLIVGFGFFIFPHLPYGIETVHEFWRFALFLSNIDEIIVGARDSINFLTVTWTVSVEEQFYLAWGILIGLFTFRKTATYLLFFLAIIAASLLFRAFNLHDHRVLEYHTFSVMSDLATGGIIGLCAWKGLAQRWMEWLPRWSIVLIYLAGGVLLLWEDLLFRGSLFIFERFIPGLFLAFIILEQIYAKNSFYKIDRFPGFFRGGKLTYGLYMYHCIYIYYWSIFFRSNGYTTEAFQFILFTLAVLVSTYLTSHVSYHYFEKPFLGLKKHFR